MSLSLLSFANLLKAIVTLLLTKAVAVSFGPSGIAALGGLQNILGIVGPVSSLGANSGTILFVSKSKTEDVRSVIYTLAVLLFAGFLLGISVLYLAWRYLKDTLTVGTDVSMISLAAFCLSSSVVALVAGYLQGRGQFEKFAWATIIGSIVNFIILAWGFNHFSLSELVNLASVQLCIYAISLCFLARTDILEWFGGSLLFQWQIILPIIKMGSLSLIAGVVLSAGFINIRGHLIQNNGLDVTGNWDAAMRIYPLIVVVICMPIFTRYFPELCRKKTALEVVALYRPIIKNISVLFGFGLVIAYFLSNWIVHLIFADSFKLYMGTMFLFLIGDVIRSYSTILNYINLASENYLKHFLCEIIFVCSLVLIVNNVQITSFQILAYIYIAAAFFSFFSVLLFIGLQLINKKAFSNFHQHRN